MENFTTRFKKLHHNSDPYPVIFTILDSDIQDVKRACTSLWLDIEHFESNTPGQSDYEVVGPLRQLFLLAAGLNQLDALDHTIGNIVETE